MVRGPAKVSRRPLIALASGEPSRLGTDLARLRSSGRPRAEFEDRARRFIASDQYALRTPLPIDIGRLDAWLARQPAQLTTDALDWVCAAALLCEKSSHFRLCGVPDAALAIAARVVPVRPGEPRTKCRLRNH